MTEEILEYEGIRLDFTAADFAKVTFTRADKRNAIGAGMYSGFQKALAEMNGRNTRICVLASEGPTFCAGADLSELGKGLPGALNVASDMVSSDIFWLAEVRGGVLGAGVAIVSVCAAVLCEESSFFCLPEIRNGMYPWSIIGLLGIGGRDRWATGLGLSSRRAPAAEAMANGLVTQVLPEASLSERSASLAREVIGVWDALQPSIETWRNPLRAHVASTFNHH